jgi:hypothetical protein
LGESSLKVLYDFRGDDAGVGEVGAVFEAFVFKPEDVEVEFISSVKVTNGQKHDQYDKENDTKSNKSQFFSMRVLGNHR